MPPAGRLSVRLRRSRSNTSTEYSLPGATQISIIAAAVRPITDAAAALDFDGAASPPPPAHRGRLACASCRKAKKRIVLSHVLSHVLSPSLFWLCTLCSASPLSSKTKELFFDRGVFAKI